MKTKPLNLALQGGGSHGAFTWGVLDALLEDGRIDFDSLSATSAGAMNAAALAYGLSTGGVEKAREILEEFWSEISKVGEIFNPVKRTPLELGMAINPFMQQWSLENSPYFKMFESMTHNFSPYDLNPTNFSPLKGVLEKVIDFDAIHACECVKVFISATDVQSGTPKVFGNEEVTIDVLLASAALPFLFQAVEIDGRHYWDGGYMGNPSLWPLFYHAKARDILIIHVNPIIRGEIPKSAYDIENRVNEITFNTALMKELRAIDFVKKLVNEDMLKDEYKDDYTDVLLHAVSADDALGDLSVASKFDTSWGFLTHLRDLGREHGKKWINAHYKDLGQRSSVDIRERYLDV